MEIRSESRQLFVDEPYRERRSKRLNFDTDISEPDSKRTRVGTSAYRPTKHPIIHRKAKTFSLKIPKLQQESALPLYQPSDPRFFEITQSLVNRFHHAPLPGESRQPDKIARPIHGAIHQCRAAVWVAVLLSIRKGMEDPEALAFRGDYLPYVMIAAMLHDSGRKGEGVDTPEWEKSSGENCEDFLLSMGCPSELAAECRRAIINKDGAVNGNKTLVEKLIHDADCLEIMRVPECRSFDMSYLDLFQDAQNDPAIQQLLYQLSSQVRAVIAYQGDLGSGTRIVNQATGFQELDDFKLSGYLNTAQKTAYEFSSNVMAFQLGHLKVYAPELYELYCQSAGVPPEHIILRPTMLDKKEGHKGYSYDTGFAGRYHDAGTGADYYIKEPVNPESARNEVLMANLARELGLYVPETRLIREKGRTFVASRWVNGLRVDREALGNADPKQLARLYLVAAVLGNVDIVGYSFDNTLVDEQGNLVPLDWGEAGEFGAPGASKRKENCFTGVVYELDTLLNCEDPRVDSTIDPSVKPAYHNAVNVFQHLDPDVVKGVVKELLAVEGSQISRLVAAYGPDLPLDQAHLNRVLHDRLAYLARRFPECCPSRVTQAEQGAIEAAGVDGYSLPVSGRDIVGGDLRLFHYQDHNNQPVTESWVRLNTEANRRLNQQLGLPLHPYKELKELKALIANVRDEQFLTPEVRFKIVHAMSVTQRLLDWYEHCAAMLPDQYSKYLETFQTKISYLQELQAVLSANLSWGDGERCDLPYSVWQTSELSIPEGWEVDTDPDSSHCEKVSPSNASARTLRFGRAWENSDRTTLAPYHYQLMPQGVAESDPDVEIAWFGDNSPENRAMEGILRIRTQGLHKDVSQKLVDALQALGIDTRRPDSDDIQTLYLDSLIRCYRLTFKEESYKDALGRKPDLAERECWLCNELGWQTMPRWEQNHRILSGHCVFYRPIEADDKRTKQGELKENLIAHHTLNFASSKGATENIVGALFHCGGNLASLVDRKRMGISTSHSTSHKEDMASGGGQCVFLRVTDAGVLSIWSKPNLVIKPDTLLRTDVTALTKDLYGSQCTGAQHIYAIPPGPKAWARLASHPRNEVILPFISMEEVESLHLTNDKERRNLTALQSKIASAPDGRMFSSIISFGANRTRASGATHQNETFKGQCFESKQMQGKTFENCEFINCEISELNCELNFDSFKGNTFRFCDVECNDGQKKLMKSLFICCQTKAGASVDDSGHCMQERAIALATLRNAEILGILMHEKRFESIERICPYAQLQLDSSYVSDLILCHMLNTVAIKRWSRRMLLIHIRDIGNVKKFLKQNPGAVMGETLNFEGIELHAGERLLHESFQGCSLRGVKWVARNIEEAGYIKQLDEKVTLHESDTSSKAAVAELH
ncbi:hypothetical protein [Parendozoicomonas haliclonae]|uniref:SidE PDE domain-containing protein n=1 Tax=Parendozoicomonas haliclonae TaxID=1960125 RepID=A0A1X7AMT9_9GAMM|nr:hypothetical protein [Parendozoicomonas haliclonae]SMA49601.1 hypothetical protein EHSB41UT_03386 [Parendozoicomonas haliclonae]